MRGPVDRSWAHVEASPVRHRDRVRVRISVSARVIRVKVRVRVRVRRGDSRGGDSA